MHYIEIYCHHLDILFFFASTQLYFIVFSSHYKTSNKINMLIRTELKNGSLFFLVIVLLAGCGSKEVQKRSDDSVKVVVKEILQEQQVEVLSYSGTIEADITVSIGFSVPGRITSVFVQEGE